MVKKKSKRQRSSPKQPKPTKVPVAKGYTTRASPPSINGSGSCRIRKREFVGTVTNTIENVFHVSPLSTAEPGLDFNPGQTTLFPWLSTIANNYERFRFHHLSFDLLPSVATTTPGRLYAAIDYDYDDSVPTLKQVMMGNRSATETPVWERLTIRCDAKQLHPDMPFKYINTAGRSGGATEPRTCFSGFLILAYDTTAAVGTVKHDLWVDYDVDLTIPQAEMAMITRTGPDAVPDEPSVNIFPFVSGLTRYAVFRTQNRELSHPRLPVRIAGVDEVPPLNVSSSDAGFFKEVIDLGHTDQGQVEVTTRYKVTDDTPSVTMEFQEPTLGITIFDKAGTIIGYVHSLAALHKGLATIWSAVGTDAGSPISTVEWTPNNYVEAGCQFAISELKRVLPEARWLVPFCQVYINAVVAGMIQMAVQYAPSRSGIPKSNLVFRDQAQSDGLPLSQCGRSLPAKPTVERISPTFHSSEGPPNPAPAVGGVERKFRF